MFDHLPTVGCIHHGKCMGGHSTQTLRDVAILHILHGAARCSEEPHISKVWVQPEMSPTWTNKVLSGSNGVTSLVPGSKLPLFPYNRGWSSTQ